jgi:hypothetical protein
VKINRSPDLAQTLAIPWGRADTLSLDWPADWPVPEVVWPDLDGAVPDYAEALNAALDRHGGLPAFGELIGPGKTVAIVVDDPSRWTPVREALPIVLDRLHRAGVRREDVSIAVGVGRHLAVDGPSMRRRVGDAIVDAYPCLSPPLDDLREYFELGITVDGIAARVFRPVASAHLRILIGSVLPHLQAGFGGGYKLIFPGCSHRSTLVGLHRMGLGRGLDAARLLGGDACGNPMRQAIRNAASLLPGPCLSISHLMGAPGDVLRVVAGHPDVVQDALAAEARRRFRAPEGPPADVVVAGNDPWPGDPMQSFKVLLQHQNAARKGGVLVGLFWTDPAEVDRSMPLPWLRAIAAGGMPGGLVIRHGLKAADGLASRLDLPSSFMVRWARELVVDRHVLIYAPELRRRVGPRLGPVRLFGEQGPLWRAVAEALPRGLAPVARVFPRGGLTYCPKAGP